jgi:signal transduction histidine kinase
MPRGDGGEEPGNSDTDRAVAFLLRQLAHELRTPLGSLSLWLRLLEEEARIGPPSERTLAMVEDSTKALVQFAQDLSDAASILGRSLVFERHPVEMRVLLERVLEAARPRARAKGIDVQPSLCPEPALLHADPGRLARAFDALLERALAHTPEGGRLEVHLEVRHGRAVVEIATAGLGPDRLPALAERLSPRTNPGPGGLELPLVLARHFLEGQGATIEAQARALRVLLPLAAPAS